MESSGESFQHLLHKLLSSINCASCGHTFSPEQVKVLGQQQDLWFLSLFCPQCHSYSLVAATVKEERPPLPWVKGEMPRRKRAASVSEKDLQNIKSTLENFSGNFSTLFSSLEKGQG